MTILRFFLMLFLPIFFISCSTIEKTALSTTSNLFYKATKEIETEYSWEMFEDSISANLKTMEGFLFLDKTNEPLLVSLTKGYAALGIGVHDTLYLDDVLGEKSSLENKTGAVYAYSKAIKYGFRYLEEKGITFKHLMDASRKNDGIVKLLNDELDNDDEKDLTLAFFMAQAWASLINISKDDPKLMSELTMAKGLFDWVCESRPDFWSGSCKVFYGAYEAGRPKMLGGNPLLGKKHFEDGIKKYPNNMFIRIAYIQYYLIPSLNEEDYKLQKSDLDKLILEFNNKKNWSKQRDREDENSENLLNAIAVKRFQIIKKHEKDIF